MSAASIEQIVSEALRSLVTAHIQATQVAASVTTDAPQRIPLRLRDADDVAELLGWLQRLYAHEQWRSLYLSGQLQLSIELGASVVNRVQPSVVPAESATQGLCIDERLDLNESVITEALLRRLGTLPQLVQVPGRAVITPAARDYARSVGIRWERKP